MPIQFAYGSLGWGTSMSKTAKHLRESGYDGIEGFGLLDLLPEDSRLLEALQEERIQFVGSFFSSSFVYPGLRDSEIENFIATCEQIKAFNGHIITVSGGRKDTNQTPDNLKENFEYLTHMITELWEIASTFKIKLCFHPHYGTLVFTREEIERFVAQTPEELGLCLDTGHLVAADADVVDSMYTFRNRIGHVHLKDCERLSEREFSFKPLGDGCADIRSAVRLLQDLSYDGWATVELDAVANPYKAAVQSRAFLRGIGV